MNRKQFIRTLTVASGAAYAMKIQELEKITDRFASSDRMPMLFIGHGHPMNALLDNDFTQSLSQLGASLERPAAALVVSAHWQTQGTYVSVNARPKTIYDFGNFDPRLFQIHYEPIGSPKLARTVVETASAFTIKEDIDMGLDHGTWTVMRYIFPKADVPTFQLSLDYRQSPTYHYQLGQALQKLRQKGVLIIGSGNIVHNLRMLDWQNLSAQPYEWAIEFDATVKQYLDQRHFDKLVRYHQLGAAARMSVPTNDHYLPMLYLLGLMEPNERIHYSFEGFQHAGISMRSFVVV